MIRHQVTIQNKLGLHTRAAARLVDVAKRYACKIELLHRDRTADCKSIMGLITLGAQRGNILDLTITGEDEDEQQALAAVTKLIDDKFGEGE